MFQLKQHLIFCLLIFRLFSGKAQEVTFTPVDSETNASFRGLSIVNNNIIWLSGNNGWIGRSIDGGLNWDFNQIDFYEKDDFRSIYAFDEMNALVVAIASPAKILRTNDGGKTWLLVYLNDHADMFLDGIDFWDLERGLVYGDPIDGRMMLLNTNDGGISWQEVDEKKRPLLAVGESSFAASGGGIRCFEEKKVVVATGGLISRLWTSSDNGESWLPVPVPVTQGGASAGIYSTAVFAPDNFTVVGGDYTQEDQAVDHIFISNDAGKHWMAPDIPTKGYRESVEYLDENSLIATGPNGTEISNDAGLNWMPIQGREGMHVVRKARNGNLVVLAGRNGKIFLLK
jgi:photosystem II stability/assembly factor-like uncharacterized protein